MRQHTKLVFTLIVAFVPFTILASAAHAACPSGQAGTTLGCPTFTAPATTAVPGPSMDGSMTVPQGGVVVTLFSGVTPPNGFMVQINAPNELGNTCNISDNLPATISGVGFLIGGVFNTTPLPNTFITPPGYKPIGPVSIICTSSITIAARGW